jgi:2,4-dienoyl-CoA reductase-like NADH-dependent reductase (Old Yellow Enzyme family)
MADPATNEPAGKRRRFAIPDVRWPTRVEAAGSRLFSPIRVGALAVRTRTWVPAMVPWRATDEGFVTPEVLAWYGRFAEGRPGVLVVEATGIRDVPSGPLLRIGHARFLPGLSELVRTVRERSRGETRLLIQIIDFLAIRRRPTKENYLRRFLALDERHRDGLARHPEHERVARAGSEGEVREALLSLPHEDLLALLSARERDDLELGYRERVNDLELPHVRELPRVLPELFGDAAERARDAGFDGVELHYAHAYTMASFLSRTNVRDDGYGGSPENRVRLPLEVFAAVRARVGRDFTVGCRYLSDEVIEGGSRLEEATFYGERFAAAGMDFLSLSKGGKFDDAKQPKVGEAVYPYTGPSGLECMPTVYVPGGPLGRNLPLARAVRERVRAAGLETPIVGCGGINSFELAEAALARGDCDLVGAARQSLADPDWWLKMELGRGAETRRCLYTNYCEGLDQKHVEVTCQLWDREFDAPDSESSGAVRRTKDGKRRLEPPAWSR